MFLCDPWGPPCSWRPWDRATPCLPAGAASVTPSASDRPFVPIARHSPMTFYICRLTTESREPALRPCTIPHPAPSSPGAIPQLPSSRFGLVQRSRLPPGLELICRSLISRAGEERDEGAGSTGFMAWPLPLHLWCLSRSGRCSAAPIKQKGEKRGSCCLLLLSLPCPGAASGTGWALEGLRCMGKGRE